MRLLTFILGSLLLTISALAQAPSAARSDVWGKAPQGSDDRFTNPKSKLYAGPDGWFNTGEVRATVRNSAKPPYQYLASFQPISGVFTAVKGLLGSSGNRVGKDHGTDRSSLPQWKRMVIR